MLPVKTEPKRDGRHARAERTHEAIVNALLELADEGNLSPTARQIADRADIALRSIRQHFASREALFLAAAAAHAKRSGTTEPISPKGRVHERVATFVKARAIVLEQTSALRRAASLEESKSAAISRTMNAVSRARRHEVERMFAHELDRLNAEERKTILDAADLASSGRSWDAMRRDMKLSVDAARDVMETTLLKLFLSLIHI